MQVRILKPGMKLSHSVRGTAGVTLVELLVAIGASSIILLGLTMLVRNMIGSFHHQDMLADMMQNAHFTVQRVSEVLSETGACLPVKADTVMTYDSVAKNKFTRRYNPDCGYHQVTKAQKSTRIWVDTNGAYFLKADTIIVAYDDTTVRWRQRKIGVKDTTNSLRADSVEISLIDTVAVYDQIFGYKTETWGVTSSGKLYIDTGNTGDTSMVLAENIDTLRLAFDSLDLAGGFHPVTRWKDMRNGTVTVVARTERPDPFKHQYHRQEFTTRFRFKTVVAR